MKRVVIVGSAGQDGRILQEQLQGKADVMGVKRASAVDILDSNSVDSLMRHFVPDEVYYLAAHHHAAVDAQEPMPELLRESFAVHVSGWTNVLEAISLYAPQCHVFYASSSHVFGAPGSPTQDESTPFQPIGVYGITKVAGMHVGRLYRKRGLFVSCGILYNHESVHRSSSFLSQRIVRAARNREHIRLGRLDATVDWGSAEDTVRAMRLILTLSAPDDFVVATGQAHTVRDFASAAYVAVGCDYREFVEEDTSLLHKPHTVLIGDARKLRLATGWSPTVTFDDLVMKLVRT